MSSHTFSMEPLQQALERVRPHLPTLLLYAAIVLSALFPIYTGAHASLSRPASAAPPRKEKGKGVHDFEDEEEETLQPMESLSASDAILFPIIAACVLATLYWLIERYGADIINLIMSWYLAGAGVVSVIKLLKDSANLVLGFPFPQVYGYKGRLWSVQRTEDAFASSTKQGTMESKCLSPYPGTLGRLPLPSFVLRSAWFCRRVLKQKYATEVYIKEIIHIKTQITAVDVVAVLFGLAVVAYSNIVHNYWWLTNIQGFAVSYFALQVLSPTSFAVGSLVLCGLFFYDIWAVFFTPLMVTVATKLDQPIKLVFPRLDLAEEDKALQFSMLGLGDIVLPGLVIGLCLRYDLYMFWLRKQTARGASRSSRGQTITKAPYTSPRGHWINRYWTSGLPKDMLPSAVINASFPKPYFYAAIFGYTVGLSATLGVVAVYNHAQPALLYLVPSVLACVWGTGLVRGELNQMWEYTEELTGDAVEHESPETSATSAVKDDSWWHSFLDLFSSNKSGDSVEASNNTPAQQLSNGKASQTKADKPDSNTLMTFSVRRISQTISKQTASESRTTQSKSKEDQLMQNPSNEDLKAPDAGVSRSLRSRQIGSSEATGDVETQHNARSRSRRT